ncbi:hypothetical protein [Paenibacillus sp. SYP-B3998]|nr:hypothetical protein [Paenibacillus sp. SYP-B3998]
MTSSFFNEWLDEYNDFMTLYRIFGDEEYREDAKEVLNSLAAMVVRAEQYQKTVQKIMSNRVHAF